MAPSSASGEICTWSAPHTRHARAVGATVAAQAMHRVITLSASSGAGRVRVRTSEIPGRTRTGSALFAVADTLGGGAAIPANDGARGGIPGARAVTKAEPHEPQKRCDDAAIAAHDGHARVGMGGSGAG